MLGFSPKLYYNLGIKCICTLESLLAKPSLPYMHQWIIEQLSSALMYQPYIWKSNKSMESSVPPHTHTLCGHFARQNILDVYLNQIAADTKLYSHGNYNPEVESLAPEPNKQLKSREHNTTQRTEETKAICLEC